MIMFFKYVIIFLFIIFYFLGVRAEEVYFELSEDNIEIKTDFDGKEIIIFGLLQDNHDTLITIKELHSKIKYKKKRGILGFG